MRRSLAVVLAFVLATGMSARAQEPTLVIENGRVVVGDGMVLEEASVLVAGDSILSVTSEPVEAPDARRFDASGKTVLPGLIDAHVHLTVPPDGRDSTALTEHLKENVPGILRGFLQHGVTTVRSTGEYWPRVSKLQDRIADGELQGPRIVTAGPVLTAEGAHPATSACAALWSDLELSRPDPFCRAHLAEELTTPEEARAAVQRLAEEGVDYIKFVSDSTIAPVQIEDELTRAIIDQAHQEGLKAVGHVAEPAFMERAAEAGIDGFVHLPLDTLSDDRARQLGRTLTKHETPVTTTLSLVLLSLDQPTRPTLQGNSPMSEYGEVWARNAATLAGESVPLVVGTDWCPCFPGAMGSEEPPIQPGAVTITEIELLRWGGMSRHAIIQAATSNAARALEMGDEVGTLEEGKLADLIVVDGNPLEDLSALDEAEVVVQGGEVVAGQLTSRLGNSNESEASSSLEARDIVFASTRVGSDSEIWRMRPDGSNPRRLTNNEGVEENFPDWSPDGSEIVFLSTRDTSRQGLNIFVMEADGSNVRAVGPRNWPDVAFPEWSPDGSEILFSAGSSFQDRDLYVMNADGSEVRQLTSVPTSDRCASWGPEGNRIVYMSSEDGENFRLMIQNLDSGDARNALPEGMEGWCADWSPDGDRIAFSSGPDGQLRSLETFREKGPGVAEIFILDLQAESVTQLTDKGGINYYPRWSPDGERLVFHSRPRVEGSPTEMEPGQMAKWFEVYTMKPDGSDVRRLTENEFFDGHPNW